MPFKFGPMELVLILIIVLVIFGAAKLPEIGSSMGKAIRGFKKAATGQDEKQQLESSKNKEEAVAESPRKNAA